MINFVQILNTNLQKFEKFGQKFCKIIRILINFQFLSIYKFVKNRHPKKCKFTKIRNADFSSTHSYLGEGGVNHDTKSQKTVG